MDSVLSGLLAMLPVTWQPYVIVFLIVAYVVTKWRSNKKSAQLKAQKSVGRPVGMFESVVEFLF